MKQINLQATGVLDDLAHFRYAECRFFSDHARFFYQVWYTLLLKNI